MDELKDKIDKSATFKANSLLFMGSSVLLGQLVFIGYGTFVEFSWDIMEPFSYMIMLGNFTAGFYYYCFKK